MRVKSLLSRLSPLPHLRLSLWAPFLIGWMLRQRNQVVPCALPACRELLRIPLDDFYRSFYFFSETRQGRNELSFFLDRLRSNEVLYDVGGYRGAYSAAAKARSRAGVSVHVFEPVASNYEAIRRISEVNHFSDFQIIPLAAAEGNQLHGAIGDEDRVFHSGDRTAQTVDLPAISLDSYIARGAPAPTVMKVDVDGFELAVLRGAKSCLLKYRPHLWLEVHPGYLQNQGSSQEEVLGFLREIGYTVTPFVDSAFPEAATAYHVWCE